MTKTKQPAYTRGSYKTKKQRKQTVCITIYPEHQRAIEAANGCKISAYLERVGKALTDAKTGANDA